MESLSSSYKAKRDLLTEMLYTRLNDVRKKVEVTRRGYAYDALRRPTSRTQVYPPQQKFAREDPFDYNRRSESARRLAGRLDRSAAFAPEGRGRVNSPVRSSGRLLMPIPTDNIGNRITAQEDAESVTYETNELNQYTLIKTNGADFTPDFDADGNQTLIQTSTGIWRVTYNAQNRAARYESADGSTIITCVYDYMGRRVRKQVVKDGVTTLDDRFFYRGYLQVAAYDWLPATKTSRCFLVWDPTQSVATRPLAIRTGGTAYAYGWDLTKNICELYGPNGYIVNRYAYTPFGSVTQTEGSVNQPFTWSSEAYDEELGLVYYNFRYYNPCDGRWMRREPGMEYFSINLYAFALNNTMTYHDVLGFWNDGSYGDENAAYKDRGHSDFPGQGMFDYTKEDNDLSTSPFNPASTWRHFRDLPEVEDELLDAVKECDKGKYESRAHQMQDYFSHYKQGFESSPLLPLYIIISFIPGLVSWVLSGHAIETRVQRITHQGKKPDNPEDYREDYEAAKERTQAWLDLWSKCCKQVGGQWERDNCTDCSHIDIP